MWKGRKSRPTRLLRRRPPRVLRTPRANARPIHRRRRRRVEVKVQARASLPRCSTRRRRGRLRRPPNRRPRPRPPCSGPLPIRVRHLLPPTSRPASSRASLFRGSLLPRRRRAGQSRIHRGRLRCPPRLTRRPYLPRGRRAPRDFLRRESPIQPKAVLPSSSAPQRGRLRRRRPPRRLQPRLPGPSRLPIHPGGMIRFSGRRRKRRNSHPRVLPASCLRCPLRLVQVRGRLRPRPTGPNRCHRMRHPSPPSRRRRIPAA